MLYLNTHYLGRKVSLLKQSEAGRLVRCALWTASSIDEAIQLSKNQTSVRAAVSAAFESSNDTAVHGLCVPAVVPAAFVVQGPRSWHNASLSNGLLHAWQGAPESTGLLASDEIVGWLDCSAFPPKSSHDEGANALNNRATHKDGVCLTSARSSSRCGKDVELELAASLGNRVSTYDYCAFSMEGTEGNFCLVRALLSTNYNSTSSMQSAARTSSSVRMKHADVGVLVAGAHLNTQHHRQFVRCNADCIVVRTLQHAREALAMCPVSRIVCLLEPTLAAAPVGSLQALLCDAVVAASAQLLASDEASAEVFCQHAHEPQARSEPSTVSWTPELALRAAFGLYVSQISGWPLRPAGSRVASWIIHCADIRVGGLHALSKPNASRVAPLLAYAVPRCLAELAQAVNLGDVAEAEATFVHGASETAQSIRARAWQRACSAAWRAALPSDDAGAQADSLPAAELLQDFVWELGRPVSSRALASPGTGRAKALPKSTHFAHSFVAETLIESLGSGFRDALVSALNWYNSDRQYRGIRMLATRQAWMIRCCERFFRKRPRGVNVAGLTMTHIGLGTAARDVHEYVTTAFGTTNQLLTHVRFAKEHELALMNGTGSRELVFSHTILVCYPVHFRPLLEWWGTDQVYTTHLALNMFLEVTQLPSMALVGASLADSIIAPTSFIARMFTDRTWNPEFVSKAGRPWPFVQTLRPFVSRRIAANVHKLSGAAAGAADQLPGKSSNDHDDAACRNTTFLFVFDHNSHVDRKNPQGAVEAFQRAFGNAGEQARLSVPAPAYCHNRKRFAELVLKTTRLPESGDKVALFAKLASVPGVRFVSGLLPERELEQLRSSVTACLSLHRSEGLGLNLLASMAAGVPCIMTNASGNVDFASAETAFLVPAVIKPLGSTKYFQYFRNASKASWFEPDLDAAADWMRKIHANPELALWRGARAARYIDEHWRISASHADALFLLLDELETVRPQLWARSFSVLEHKE